MSGTISNKDQKILWSRAAGRCSKPDCRRKLTFDQSKESGSITFGQMCHIVGEKNSKKSPRGISKLPVEVRNEYSNLILLCANHHELIDGDEEGWPVELLHKMKDDHELWVEESLTSYELTPEIVVYSNIIDNLNSYLRLDNYDWFMSNAIKNILHRDFVESLDFVEERQIAIDWPGTNKKLEKAIKDLMQSYSDYVRHFLKYSILDERNCEYYREDTTYKRIFPNPHYQTYTDRNTLWIKKNFFLLSIYVYYLNEFTKKVRENFNPIFHLKRGKFLVIDDFGMYHGGNSTSMLPDIKEIKPYLERINKQIEEFEKENTIWS